MYRYNCIFISKFRILTDAGGVFVVILGIDPGLATVGFGVIDYSGGKFGVIEYGAILTKAGLPVEDRLLDIHQSVCELCHTFKPAAVSVEELFFNVNRKTAVPVCEAR